LAERVEAEPRDQIGPPFDAMTTSTDSGDKTRPHVYPRWHAQAEYRFNPCCAGNDGVDPSFDLDWLLGEPL
jgi:hypothetical protein